MAKRFIPRNVLASAASLMVAFRVRAGGAGVPDGYIISTGEAVVVVVELFVVVRGT